jgi:hypothetical protein
MLALKLIDYDGMWVPALAGTRSGEVGHPSYQHPQRLREGPYNIDVDRFPLLLVATALRAPTDYAAISGITVDVVPAVFPPSYPRFEAMPVDEALRLSDILDGESSTLLVAEGAGRPQVWLAGQATGKSPPNDKSTWSAWNGNFIRGYSKDGKVMPGHARRAGHRLDLAPLGCVPERLQGKVDQGGDHPAACLDDD